MVRPYSSYCCEDKRRTPAPHVLTEATLDDQIRFHLGHVRRCGEPAGELETVSFDILIAQRRYAGVRARLVNRSNAACPISIHMPLALMN